MSQKRPRNSDSADLGPRKRRKLEIRPPNIRDWNLWVSATNTKNYLLNDPFLDWLSYHSITIGQRHPSYVPHITKALTKKSDTNNFTEFIMAKGIEFEEAYIRYLYQTQNVSEKTSGSVIVDIGGGKDARSEEKAQQTIECMNRGVPIIYSGVLHNESNETYGVPDLIVRSDWIRKLVTLDPLNEGDAKIQAPLLTNPRGQPPNYHYRIIDIKFTTLALRADGLRLLNSGMIPAYKGQLWIYNLALARIQGYEPPQTYILGRGWKYTSKGELHRGNSCVDRLGVIDFEGVDYDVIQKTKDAIQWIKLMRTEGDKWDPFAHNKKSRPWARSSQSSRSNLKPELYPNMCNSYDYPWHHLKETIAKEISEITNLWMCGVKNRKSAHSQGVYKWSDPRCTTSILGITGPKIQPILDSILMVNRGKTKMLPKIIKNNDRGWQTKREVEFYVDFEYVGDIVAPFTIPIAERFSLIFMIGVGHYDEFDEWIYTSFIVDDLTQVEESRICQEFTNYVRREAQWHQCPNPLLIHWSHAESTQWTSAYSKHASNDARLLPMKCSLTSDTDPEWFDLLQIFKKEPIVTNGCLSFGLKDVAGAFAKHGFIQATWNLDEGMNGQTAMIQAYIVSLEAKSRGVKMRDLPKMKEIEKYNEVDCKVLGEILRYLRAHRTLPRL